MKIENVKTLIARFKVKMTKETNLMTQFISDLILYSHI